jgi:O-antigen ligase
MIADHPWLGVGPGNFQAAYRTRYILPQAWSEPNLHHAHNVMLDLWARVGVPGLAAWIALQAGFWRALLQRPATAEGRRQRALRIGLLGSMAAVLAHGLVDTPIFYTDLAMITALMVALAVDLGRRDAPDSSRSEG